MTETDIKALPCPFCGCVNIEVVDGSSYRWTKAECTECGAASGEVRKTTKEPVENTHRVLREWNQRRET